MEVDLLISSSIDTIVSPARLAGAIGVPPRAKLCLRRDSTDPDKSRLVVRCNKRTASNLKHRFSALSSYAHEGTLTSLKVVGVRPIFQWREGQGGDHPWRNPRHDGARISATAQERSGARVELSLVDLACGVEYALHVVGLEADNPLRDVAGIAELYNEFLATSMRANIYFSWRRTKTRAAHSSDDEEKQGWFETIGEDNSDTSQSEETKRGSLFDESSGRAGHQHTPLRRRRHRRPWRPRQNAPCEGPKKTQLNKPTDAVAEHLRHVLASVEDTALALTRISRVYSDAPRRVKRDRVISLLARLYVDGNAFADNRRRAYETLDSLGVVQWHAKAQPQATLQAQSRQNFPSRQREHERTVADDNWLRLLRRVLGLVRGIVDFGVFVQVYVAAVKAERPVASFRMNGPVDGRTTSVGGGGRPHGVGDSASGTSRRDTSLSPPTQLQAGQASAKENKHGVSEQDKPLLLPSPPASDPLLPWLFTPDRGGGEEGARLAFDRHAVCGGAMHGLITLESAVTIVRDAGKVLPAERAWRYWRCGEREFKCNNEGGDDRDRTRPLPRGGLLLGFREFVDMCEGLKSYFTNASIMDEEN